MTKKFSDRLGFTSSEVPIQLDYITDDLKNSLWNFARTVGPIRGDKIDYYSSNKSIETIFLQLYKYPIDAFQQKGPIQLKWLAEVFFSSSTHWYEIYNIMEFLCLYLSDEQIGSLNYLLENENSGYRFIDGQFVPISNKAEIVSIEETIKLAKENKLSGARTHIATALQYLSAKPDPDYRNAIKEAISSLESLVTVLGGKGNFSTVISKLNEKLEVHPALIKGITNLYGYTSNEEGIRHAILEQKIITYDDAKYMIVMCSGLFNFLVSKANKVGLLD